MRVLEHLCHRRSSSPPLRWTEVRDYLMTLSPGSSNGTHAHNCRSSVARAISRKSPVSASCPKVTDGKHVQIAVIHSHYRLTYLLLSRLITRTSASLSQVQLCHCQWSKSWETNLSYQEPTKEYWRSLCILAESRTGENFRLQPGPLILAPCNTCDDLRFTHPSFVVVHRLIERTLPKTRMSMEPFNTLL
jgi:hypothetical protein